VCLVIFHFMDGLSIVPVTISEQYAAISKLMRGLHEHEHILNDKTAHWDDIEAGYMRHVISMQEEGEGLCLIAYIGSEPVGFIFGYLEEQDDSRIEIYMDKELYVSDGYVADEYRRMGIYKQLNERLEQHYINLGVKRINRFTHLNNSRMKRFMEQQGYVATRVLYEKWI